MASEKTDAIMIRIVDFSESSCIATMFTRDFGKIGVMVKGARRPKSPFESAIDLLTESRIVFIHKSSDSLDLLTEAKLSRRFRAATRSLPHLYAGYYLAELLDALTHVGDPHPDLYELARETVIELDELHDPLSLVIRFELNLLRLLGQNHLSKIARCVVEKFHNSRECHSDNCPVAFCVASVVWGSHV